MKRIDNTYWTDGKDIFYRQGDAWVKVETVTGEDSTVIDAGFITVTPVKGIDTNDE